MASRLMLHHRSRLSGGTTEPCGGRRARTCQVKATAIYVAPGEGLRLLSEREIAQKFGDPEVDAVPEQQHPNLAWRACPSSGFLRVSRLPTPSVMSLTYFHRINCEGMLYTVLHNSHQPSGQRLVFLGWHGVACIQPNPPAGMV